MKVRCHAGIDALMVRYSDPTSLEFQRYVEAARRCQRTRSGHVGPQSANLSPALAYDRPCLHFPSLPPLLSFPQQRSNAAAAHSAAIAIVGASSHLFVPTPLK